MLAAGIKDLAEKHFEKIVGRGGKRRKEDLESRERRFEAGKSHLGGRSWGNMENVPRGIAAAWKNRASAKDAGAYQHR